MYIGREGVVFFSVEVRLRCHVVVGDGSRKASPADGVLMR